MKPPSLTPQQREAMRAAVLRCALPEAEVWAVLGPLVEALPREWKTRATEPDGAAFLRRDGLRVVVSVARHDGKRWIHASASRPKEVPSYDDLKELHARFCGAERKAIQVFAPASEHVNIHPNCLHLWACLDGDGLPDFTEGTGSL